LEVSALKHAGAAGLHGRSPLLRLQSDERLVALVRRGNQHAFEALVSRYQARLLAFCRHMLASKEDAEDVLQEVFAASYNAMVADERPINVRPWLYRIARNRSLNHLRRQTAIGVDSMDIHLAEHGQTTADQVHRREEFRLLVADVQELPESQRTALLLREIDALPYEQIAEVMETTVPSVKSLLVRARVSLAEMAEARLLSCDEVRLELGEVAEGLKRTTAPVRRHLRGCDRCQLFRKQLRNNNKALAVLMPVGPLLLVKKLFLAHLGTTAAAGSGGAAAGGAAAAGGGAAAAGAMGGGLAQAGLSALAAKAAAGLAAAAIVTAGAVEVKHVTEQQTTRTTAQATAPVQLAAATAPIAVQSDPQPIATLPAKDATAKPAATATPDATATPTPAATPDATATPDPGTVQHDSDTTTLSTEYSGSTQPAPGAYNPGHAGEQQASSAPAEEPQGHPQTTSEPAPASPVVLEPIPTPDTTPTPEPTPTPTPEPTPVPSPEPTPDPAAAAAAG
jgi:RNA polymerase sigma factor (sigma-70 family)